MNISATSYQNQNVNFENNKSTLVKPSDRQMQALEELYKTTKLVATPTGIGKTSIAQTTKLVAVPAGIGKTSIAKTSKEPVKKFEAFNRSWLA